MRFSTTSKERTNGIKILVYGSAGSGKTYLCSTAPNPLIISNEAGLITLQEFDIPVIVVETINDLYKAYDFITTDKKGTQFDTYCFDSLSEISEVILANEKSKVRDKRQAYGELAEQTVKIVKMFRDIRGKNVYFTAKEKKVIDAITETVWIGPSFPGTQLSQQIPYLCDNVFHLSIIRKNGKNIRRLLTQKDYNYEAKARDPRGALLEYEKPNLSEIFRKLTEGAE